MGKTVLEVLDTNPKTVQQLATEMGAKPGTVRMQLARTTGITITTVMSDSSKRPSLAYSASPGAASMTKAARPGVSDAVVNAVRSALGTTPRTLASIVDETDLSRSSVINALLVIGPIVTKSATTYSVP